MCTWASAVPLRPMPFTAVVDYRDFRMDQACARGCQRVDAEEAPGAGIPRWNAEQAASGPFFPLPLEGRESRGLRQHEPARVGGRSQRPVGTHRALEDEARG